MKFNGKVIRSRRIISQTTMGITSTILKCDTPQDVTLGEWGELESGIVSGNAQVKRIWTEQNHKERKTEYCYELIS